MKPFVPICASGIAGICPAHAVVVAAMAEFG
jgi:hypothetical protein